MRLAVTILGAPSSVLSLLKIGTTVPSPLVSTLEALETLFLKAFCLGQSIGRLFKRISFGCGGSPAF